MITKTDRDRKIINIVSNLPRKRNIKMGFNTIIVCFCIYLNYLLFSSEAVSRIGGLYNFLSMRSSDMIKAGIPNYYALLTAGVAIIDFLIIVSFLFYFVPKISKEVSNLWSKFPD